MSDNHWNDYHTRWWRLGLPLRPDAEVAGHFAAAIAKRDSDVLLLGVTPELAVLGKELTAVDKTPGMIANLWPGDGEHRRAVEGDWLALPFAKERFSAVIGDGSANALTYPENVRALFGEAARVLAPDGVLALRVFARTEYPEAIGELREHVMRRGIASFHAFKWRLAMAVVARGSNPNIAASAIRDNFNQLFYDRGALAEATGWTMADIETIDAYKDSREVYSFPTIGQFRSAIPDTFRNIRVADSGTYELSDRCPLLIMDRV